MRPAAPAVLALLALVALALAGCGAAPAQERQESSQQEFKSQAAEAPARLRQDMGPNGTLVRVEGAMRTNSSMRMEGQAMDMRSDATWTQELYGGDSFRVTMRTNVTSPGLSLQTAMTITCTPQKVTIRMDGLPGQAGPGDGQGGGMPDEMPNEQGTCAMGMNDPAALLNGTAGMGMGPGAGPGGMGDPFGLDGLPNLTFKGVTRDGSRDVALYEATVHLDGNATAGPGGMDGMDGMNETGPTPTLDAHYDIRATLDGGRIVHMDIAGTMTMSSPDPQDPGGMTMQTAGTMDFQYGTRGPMPA